MVTDESNEGIIYLLHFARPYKHAKHYIGFTDNLRRRLSAHASGQGARLLEVIAEAGIEWRLARTWSGSRAFERYLKNYKRSPLLCPICSGKVAFHRAAQSTQQPLPFKET